MIKQLMSSILLAFLLVIYMTSVTFAADQFEVVMYVGEVIDLDSFLIENQVLSAEEDMSWTSGNERVIDVNASGRVEAKEEGKATIYARDKKNSSKIATIKIKVISMVENFELRDEEVSIKIGEVYNLEYDIEPVGGQNKVYEDAIKWTSSYSKVVEVDDEGQIVGVKEGTAKIHAKTVDGGKKDTVIVTVSGIQEDILIDSGAKEVKIFVGGEHSFKATSRGKDVTLGVEWSSGLDDVLTIDDDGVAVGKKKGRTQVKAATKDKKKFDTIMVEVVSMVDDITLSHRAVELNNIGDTIDIDYTLIPSISGMTPFEDDVKWKSSNSGIAKVDDEGVVTAKDRGVALITATTVDGEIEAHCSITVKESVNSSKIPVGKIYLNNPVEELFVGQKYLLPIVIEPIDATELDLKFRTKIGSSSQIKEENDVYYFTPTNSGKNEITIITESKEEYVYKVEVNSPIKGVAIDTRELYKEKNKYYFYVGQRALLNPIFELEKGYIESNIFEKDVTWTVDNKNYLDIKKEKREKDNEDDETEYDYYLVGKERGTTKLKVKSKDGDYEEEIEIKIMSSYDKLELVDQVTLPINTELVPDVNVTMRDDIKYKLIPGVNYNLDQHIEIEHQYVRIEAIDEEVEMEKEIIIDLQKSAINSENSAVIYSEINEHKSRLSKLELVRETSKDGFCEIKENVELEDVFGEEYIVADLDDGIITGKRDGKIELSVTFPGTKTVAKGIYYFSSDLKGIIIVNNSGEVVSVNESGFGKILTDAALKEQMELAIKVEERYGKRTVKDTPSIQYIEAILALEKLGFISDDLKNDYRLGVTRIELAETFIALMEYISGEEMKRPSNIRFKDTTSNTAELAYELGIVDVLLPREFKPYDEVTPITFAKAVDRMVIALEAYGYNQDKLLIENDLKTGQKLFIDIDKVSKSHKSYINKWAIEYGIVEGKNNKLSPEKVLTREEFLYYIYKLLY
jgi:uncharacterized protein YjdB